MTITKKQYLVIGATALVLVAITVFLVLQNNGSDVPANTTEETTSTTTPTIGDPLDIASAYYDDWLAAIQSTSTDPFLAGLDKDNRLTTSTREYLEKTKEDKTKTVDPVTCQKSIPKRIGAKLAFRLESEAQYLMLARGADKTPEQAIVTLSAINGEWKISKIECTSGEIAPESEFSFENSGFILKGEQPPLNPTVWYLVFNENGKDGHTSPLHFSDKSLCLDTNGNRSVCTPDQFLNPSKAIVKGTMTEEGVDVEQIELQSW